MDYFNHFFLKKSIKKIRKEIEEVLQEKKNQFSD